MPRKLARVARVCAFIMAFMLAVAPLALAEQEADALDLYDAKNPQNLTQRDIIGKAAIVMDFDTGTVLFEKNADRRTFPASTTKIMTCLVALENSALGDMVTIPQEVASIPWDSSKVPVSPGEKMPMIDVLYGMMIRSGNDAAIAAADHVAGSTQAFVQMMNDRAKEIGCRDTHFTNVHGYHDPDHYTTARDMILIAREAMKNKTFREIVSAKSYTLSATSQREKKRLETMNPMFVASSKFYYPDLVGVKTGFHSKAGYCFVGAADKNGALILSVVLKTKENGRWTDTARLMDYGATRYRRYGFDELYARTPVYASIENASRQDEAAGLLQLAVVPGGTISNYSVYCLPELLDKQLETIKSGLRVNYTAALKAPIITGDILGTISMDTPSGTLVGTVIASRDVAAEAVPFSVGSLAPGASKINMPLIVGFAVVLVVVLIVVLSRRAAAKKRRRREEMRRRRQAARDRYRADR